MPEQHARIAALKTYQLPARQAAATRDPWGGLRRLPWIPLGIIGAAVFLALFAPVLAPHSPTEQALRKRLTPPVWQEGGSAMHILGTDALGRDYLSRMIYGTRVTLIVAGAALMIAGGVGLVLGTLSGYLGGNVDAVIMRTVDATLAFPTILIALMLAVTLGPGMGTVIIAIGLILWARVARVIRGEVLSIRQRDFIVAAVAVGGSPLRIMVRHILPMVANTFMVLVSLNIGYVIVLEATLSFLGAGIPPPTPTWGQMVSEGRTHITSAWWLSIVPGAAITLVVLAFNVFGDWLRDRLDPTLRHLE